jgi:TonB family protein
MEALRVPKGTGPIKEGEEGSQGQKGAGERSIASSLRALDQRLQQTGSQGLATGTGQQMGPLFFDPEGADFTAWLNHFKNEVYRNWIVPQPALLGFRGHVDIEFVVERDGRISGLKVLKPTGTPALDRAAQNALLGSRLLPLPADFGPARITMQGSFYYNEGPQGS